MPGDQWLEDVGDRNIDQVIQLESSHRIDSIVVAIESLLLLKEDLTTTERVVVVVEAMEREVGNGGFNQFFYNSSNEYAGELAAALRQIGIPDIAAIAERALQAIGAQPEWTYDEFEEAAEDPDDATAAELDACDQAYYETEDGIANTLFEFIKKNSSEISLGAKSE
ncbi:MAG: DMP19 family protein [Woeseiaceae bacterium]